MANVLTALVRWNKELLRDTHDKDRVSLLERAVADIGDKIEEYMSQEILFYSEEIDFSIDSDELVIGSEQPEKLRKLVLNWNKEQVGWLVSEVRKAEKEARESGFENVSDHIQSLLENSADGSVSVKMASSLYALRCAICVYDNEFGYGQGKLVFTDDCTGTLIQPSLYDKVKESPEDYAIVKLFYH